METTAGNASVDAVELEIGRLEQSEVDESMTVLDYIGERLSQWELVVRKTSHYALAFRIGELLEKVNQFWLALSWYQWLAAALENHVSIDLRMRAVRAKGRMYIRLGLFEEALPHLRQVEEHLNATGSEDAFDRPLVLQNIAVAYERLKQHELALEYAQVALTLFQQLEDHKRANVVEALIGICLFALKRYEQAVVYQTRARDGFEAAKDYFNLARAWHNHAELLRDWGKPEEAIAAWRMSLEMKKRNQDYTGQVNTLLSITDYLMGQHDWHAALSYVTQAFTVCHQNRLYDKEVMCLGRWSNILFSLGRYEELEVCASRALYLAKNCTTKQLVTELLQKIATYCEQIGLNQLAERFNMNAVQLFA